MDWKNEMIEGILSDVDNFQRRAKVMSTTNRVQKLQYFHVTYLAWHSEQMKARASKSSLLLVDFACLVQNTLPHPSQ